MTCVAVTSLWRKMSAVILLQTVGWSWIIHLTGDREVAYH